MTAGHQRDFQRRVVTMALGLRLLAIGVALVALVGETMTLSLLLSVAGVTGFSVLVLASRPVQDVVVRHPLLLVVDILVTLLVVAMMGAESPLVLATFSTALIIGVLLDRRTAVVSCVVLVAGYVLAAGILAEQGSGFMVVLGVPALYVFLVAIGATVRAAQEQQAAAGREVALAREAAAAADERARLARELHDSVGKSLHGIALAAHALPEWLSRSPETAASRARDLALGAEQAAQEARDLLVRMRADEPDRPLAEVLADRCARWQADNGVRCRFTAASAVDVSTGARYEMLAVVDEALENVRRHARATDVQVVLRGGPDGLELLVRDDGAGFVPRADGASPRGHFGLTGMRERAASIGGSLTVESAAGRGTTVLLRHRGEE